MHYSWSLTIQVKENKVTGDTDYNYKKHYDTSWVTSDIINVYLFGSRGKRNSF